MGDLSQVYVCIHGHFYQPPRENPFTGEVDLQPDVAPWRDWNEKITGECYAPNTAVAIRNGGGETVKVVNTYERISFDFGPTLLSWLERHAPSTYRAILAADRVSAVRFGHGSAMAQAYNHLILPLADRADKVTQVRWGITDFEHRFGRRPEGMWLPETAVDLETLAVLAEEGISFTILSPTQAVAVRRDDGVWVDLEPGAVDFRVPYLVELPDGAAIAVFFYNGPISNEIAFNGLLDDGKVLAKTLVMGLGEDRHGPALSHVATDGETYGHHHRHGELALATALEEIDTDPTVELTNYAVFLARHPATRMVRIAERSSWSCSHGVERWRADCGCATGLHPDWHQDWREPLRRSLDWLRSQLAGHFQILGGRLLRDPGEARDDYVRVLLGEPAEDFIGRHGMADLSDREREQALDLLEMQYRAMLMFTSCGWFFDDIAGLEGVYVLRHAGRAIELARRALGIDLEPGFLAILETAPSNHGGTGRDVYRRQVAAYMSGPA